MEGTNSSFRTKCRSQISLRIDPTFKILLEESIPKKRPLTALPGAGCQGRAKNRGWGAWASCSSLSSHRTDPPWTVAPSLSQAFRREPPFPGLKSSWFPQSWWCGNHVYTGGADGTSSSSFSSSMFTLPWGSVSYSAVLRITEEASIIVRMHEEREQVRNLEMAGGKVWLCSVSRHICATERF